jgi:hypothetical protein
MLAVFRTSPGQDLPDLMLPNAFQIAGVWIDNPSGSWLEVTAGTLRQNVPPYTIGWSYPCTPTQTSLSVLFTDGPAGAISENIGGDVAVTISSDAAPAFEGFPAAAGEAVLIKQEPGKPVWQVAYSVDDAIASNFSPAIITPTPGSRVYVRRVTLEPAIYQPIVGLLSNARVILYWIDPSSVARSAVLTISPEEPFAQLGFAEGAFVFDTNNLTLQPFIEQPAYYANYATMPLETAVYYYEKPLS